VSAVAGTLARLWAWTLLGLGLGAILALVAPFALGARTLTVRSGSMEPALHTGDAVVSTPIRPLDARPGDIVTFHDPARGGALVTHRLRSVRARGVRVEAVTKGDANNAIERWSVPTDGEIGRVAYRVPAVGHVLARVRTRTGMLLLVVAPLLLTAMFEIRDIWRDDPVREGENATPA
jgi:signal peptidase I